MTLSDDIAIERLARRMIDCTLPKREWTHEGHFAAALWLCRYRPDLTAPDEMRALISRYNDATGTANSDTGGYHHTITRASVRAAADRAARYAADTPLHVVLTALMASALGDPGWLLTYWRRETLFDVAARRGWVEPDLAPLPL